MGWSRKRIIQFVEWWPISFDSNLEKQVDANICIKLNCRPQLFNACWRHQPQCMVMITSLVTRVQGNSYAHWRRHPHPHPAQQMEVGNRLMTPLSKKQPFDGDLPLFPETVVRCKTRSAPQETEKKSSLSSKTTAYGASEECAKQESMKLKRFHYRNPPMWTTPAGLVLIGWRMRCPVCYHQDGHSATNVHPWHFALYDLC